jgi:hypothetical protein
MSTILDDPILAELDRIRAEYAAQYNNDVGALMKDLIQEQDALEKQVQRFVSYPPRRCEKSFPYLPID